MRILCLIDSLGSGGAQRQLVNLAILLKKRGHVVTFVVYRDDMFYKHYLDTVGISVNVVECSSAVDRIVKIRKVLRSFDGEYVISFLETPGFLACIAAVGPHRWKLITNELSAKEASFRGFKSRIYKYMEWFSCWTVCNSYNAQKMWEKHYPIYKKRLSTIYNPVMIDNYLLPQDIKRERRRVVVAASYQYLKNPIRVIEALHIMPQDYRNRLQIDWYGRLEVSTGNRKAYDEAIQLIEKYALSDVIKLHPETNQIYAEMQDCDAVALFSTVEGLPNAICEGMAFGKPILMSRVSDYETLATKENGLVCDPLSEKSICDMLMDFLDKSDDELKRMGMKSKALADALFSPRVIVEQWESLMKTLMDN